MVFTNDAKSKKKKKKKKKRKKKKEKASRFCYIKNKINFVTLSVIILSVNLVTLSVDVTL